MYDLEVFGQKAYASTLIHYRHTIGLRAGKCVFLGFKTNTKDYYCV